MCRKIYSLRQGMEIILFYVNVDNVKAGKTTLLKTLNVPLS